MLIYLDLVSLKVLGQQQWETSFCIQFVITQSNSSKKGDKIKREIKRIIF